DLGRPAVETLDAHGAHHATAFTDDEERAAWNAVPRLEVEEIGHLDRRVPHEAVLGVHASDEGDHPRGVIARGGHDRGRRNHADSGVARHARACRTCRTIRGRPRSTSAMPARRAAPKRSPNVSEEA